MRQYDSARPTFSDSSMYCRRLAPSAWCVGDMCTSDDMRFIAIIENTALRTGQGRHDQRPRRPPRPPGPRQREHVQVLRASKCLLTCGSRSVGPPFAESGTKCGRSDASHLCLSASSQVGRDAGSMVRHSETKSRAVSDTFPQYSTVRASGSAHG